MMIPKTTRFAAWILITASYLSGACTAPAKSVREGVLPASKLQVWGRYAMHGNSLHLISSAVHFEFTFNGSQCQVIARLPAGSRHNYLQYELDGVYVKRIRLEGDSAQALTITAPVSGRHTVTIFKATEAHTGDILIERITGGNVQPVYRKARPMIEFIGNSITCGAASDTSEVACGKGVYHDQHNAYYAYGPRVARTLNMDYMLSSVSGIGIYRNWNSDGPAMPEVYEKTDFQASGTHQWDFSRFRPHIVSIALGTNDFSNGDGIKKRLPFDSTRFTRQYVEFVKQVKKKHPNAQIALLSSPMINGGRRLMLHNILTEVKQQIDAAYPADKPVAVFFFKPMSAKGCTGHPSVSDHAILADELRGFLGNLPI